MNNSGFNKNNSDDNNLNDYYSNGQNLNNKNNFTEQNNAYDNDNNLNNYNQQNQRFDNGGFGNNNGGNQNVNFTNEGNSGFNNLNNYNSTVQNLNNENNFTGQNHSYDNDNNLNIYNNQNVNLASDDNSGFNKLNNYNRNDQNLNNENNFSDQNQRFDSSFLGNDNSGNQEVNLTIENNDLQNYSISNSDKKKTSKSLIIIVLSLSTLFWCFCIFIFVSGLNKTVDSTQEYLNDARIDTFIDEAKSSISIVYTDVLVNEYKPYYSLNEINSLLDKKLTLSPFGSKYKDSSCIKVINNNDISYGYDFQMCLIDEEGNGFTLTDQYDLSNNSFKVKSLKNIECSCS